MTAPDHIADLEETARDLRRTESHYQRAASRAEDARAARNWAVRAALNAGWTHAQIAEATGLSRGRISQIKQ
jgi:DNA-binding NarL/FixJ family response regulator